MHNYSLRVLLLLLICLFPGVARSASLLETTGDSMSTNPLGARLYSTGPGATYFNPTLLLDQPKSFTSGTIYLFQNLSISYLPKGTGFDVPESIFDSIPQDPDGPSYRPLPTNLLRQGRGSYEPETFAQFLSIGSVFHFARETVAFGFLALLPVKAFQTQSPFYVDEREQYFTNSLHFELFEDRFQESVISFALAGKLNKWLNLGLGLTMKQLATTTSELFLPDASQQEVSFMNSQIEVVTVFIPHLAASSHFHKRGFVTTTVHLQGESKTEGASNIQFFNYQNQQGDDTTTQTFTMVHGWQPLRVALAGGWLFGSKNRGVEVGSTILWSRWSNYVDRHGETPFDPWSDTFSVTLSAKGKLDKNTLGLDAQFVPSPVPSQEGRSNYVDNHRVAFNLGFSRRFAMNGLEMRAGATAQFVYLFERSHAKNPDHPDPVFDEFVDSKDIVTDDPNPESTGFQTNNPGWPGFSSKGWLLSIGLWLKILL